MPGLRGSNRVPGGDARTRRNWNATAMSFDDRSLGFGLTLDINRLLSLAPVPIVTVTGTYTALATDRIIICNSASDFTVTLPTAVGNTGLILDIKNKNTGKVTIEGAGSETIDLELNQAICIHNSITVVSDGTEWWVI